MLGLSFEHDDDDDDAVVVVVVEYSLVPVSDGISCSNAV